MPPQNIIFFGLAMCPFFLGKISLSEEEIKEKAVFVIIGTLKKL